ncbi:hypothetical protein EMPS_11145 [Entomortierella parvispora]|uniref:Uncharacterized protein n=1 Tax=Entomortierella parvispora TaxID=205924 RepID=A0A9P3HLH6_9FUNG|nr:hypothetical protein EMPS_11145 [Entomortierella parvispora]
MGSRTCQRLGFVVGLGSFSIILLLLYNGRYSNLHDFLTSGYSALKRTKPPYTPPISRWDPDQRYLVYLPFEGISNQFYSFQNAATMAKRLNRTLVVPPITSNRHDRLGTYQPWSHYMDLEHMSAHTGIQLVEWHNIKHLDPESLRIAEIGNRTQISEIWKATAEPLRCQVIRGFGHDYFVNTTEDSIGADFAYKYLLDLQPIPLPGYGLEEDVPFVDDILAANQGSQEQVLCFTFTFTVQFERNFNRWSVSFEEAGQYARFLPRFASYVEDLVAYRFGHSDDRFDVIETTNATTTTTTVVVSDDPALGTEGKAEAPAAGSINSEAAGEGSVFRHKPKGPKRPHQVHPHPPWDLGNSILDQGPEAETFLSRKPALDDYIAIHLRRGDIEIKCVVSKKTDCIVPLSEYKVQVDALLDYLKETGEYLDEDEDEDGSDGVNNETKQDREENKKGSKVERGDPDPNDAQKNTQSEQPRRKRLPKVVLVSDTKSEEEKQEIDSYGWYRLDHDVDPNLLDASKVLGPFSPVFVDSAVLTGRGARWVIGSRRSTMSWLAGMRTTSWFNRTVLYPRGARPNEVTDWLHGEIGYAKAHKKPKSKKMKASAPAQGSSKKKKQKKVAIPSSTGHKKTKLDRRELYSIDIQQLEEEDEEEADHVVIWDRDEFEFFDTLRK